MVEIDAASHNGVDDARELRERAVFAPARDRYKIYILDEAHMVTQQGFNALLKIVEEPPEHVKFIFATTEPDKVLTTIRSRTHHYPFRLVAPAELLGYLQQVADSEGITVDDGVMALVVRSGGGSVRDSLSLLDQLMAGSTDQTITLEGAQALLGYTPRALLDEVIAALASGDAPAAYRALDQVMQSGQDPRRFVEDLLAHLRDIIVIQATGTEATDLFPGVSQGDLQMWQEQASWFSPGRLADMGQDISDTLQHMSGVTAPRLQLELMIARLLVGRHGDQAGSSPSQQAPAVTAAPTAPPAQAAPAPPAAAQQAEEPSVDTPETPGSVQEAPAPAPAATAAVEPTADWTLEGLASHWRAIVEAVGEQKRSLWVALSETKPTGLDGDVVTIGFARRSDAEILKKPQGPGSPLPNADLLRDAIEAHTGHRVRFTISELEPHEVPAPTTPAGSDWPVVSRAGSESDDTPGVEEDDTTPHEAPADASEPAGAVTDTEQERSEEDSSSSEPAGPKLASRGEPVVRQILGGELIGEEILEEMSGQGEADV